MGYKRPSAPFFVRARANMSLIASLVLSALLALPASAAQAPQASKSFTKALAPDLAARLRMRLPESERQAIVDELARRGPASDRELLEAYATSERSMRIVFARKGESVIPRLIPLLEDAKLGAAAGKALTGAATPSGGKHAARLLKCAKAEKTALFCGMALVQVMSPARADFVPTLVKASEDHEAAVRGFAVAALGQIGAPAAAALPALVARLKDSEPQVAWAAAVALRKLGKAAKPAVPALEEAANGADGELRREAGEALKLIR